MEFKFTLDDLNRMYDDAMLWEPPAPTGNTLQSVLQSAQKPNSQVSNV